MELGLRRELGAFFKNLFIIAPQLSESNNYFKTSEKSYKRKKSCIIKAGYFK